MKSQIISELQAIVGEAHVVSKPDDLLVYECDACVAFKRRPDVVVFPATTEEASAIVQCANKHNLSIVPRGAGTGLAGGTLAETDSILVALTRMNRILEVD